MSTLTIIDIMNSKEKIDKSILDLESSLTDIVHEKFLLVKKISFSFSFSSLAVFMADGSYFSVDSLISPSLSISNTNFIHISDILSDQEMIEFIRLRQSCKKQSLEIANYLYSALNKDA